MPKLSVTVVAKNEATDLGAALASVAFADEIVVVDSHSTDETVAIARQYTDRVVIRDWLGHVEQKNHAASLASHDWILSLDADERVTPALAEEIRSTLRADPPQAAFRIPRVTWHLGRWVRSTDWYPDYQDRLYDAPPGAVDRTLRPRGADDGRSLGTAERRDPALRISRHRRPPGDHRSLHDAGRARRCTRTAGAQACCSSPAIRRSPSCATTSRAAASATASPGFIISSMNAYYVFLKFAKLWELELELRARARFRCRVRSRFRVLIQR